MKAILLFCLRFLLFAPVCLILWWQALPAYVWCLGHVVRVTTNPFLPNPVEHVSVAPGGVLNTGTMLNFIVNGNSKGMAVAALVTNVALFVALVLATGKMPWRRRIKSLAIGCVFLSLGHGVYMALALVLGGTAARFSNVPAALAQLFITLPFLLWIVLAYWDRVADLTAFPPERAARLKTAEQDNDASNPS